MYNWYEIEKLTGADESDQHKTSQERVSDHFVDSPSQQPRVADNLSTQRNNQNIKCRAERGYQWKIFDEMYKWREIEIESSKILQPLGYTSAMATERRTWLCENRPNGKTSNLGLWRSSFFFSSSSPEWEWRKVKTWKRNPRALKTREKLNRLESRRRIGHNRHSMATVQYTFENGKLSRPSSLSVIPDVAAKKATSNEKEEPSCIVLSRLFFFFLFWINCLGKRKVGKKTGPYIEREEEAGI